MHFFPPTSRRRNEPLTAHRIALRSARSLVLAVGLVQAAFAGGSALAQQPAPQASPKDYGLVFPSEGPVRQGDGRRVLIKGSDGKDVVGQIHVEVGDRRMVLL